MRTPLRFGIALKSLRQLRWGALFLFLFLLPTLRADDVLFFGNSFTFVNDIPGMMEAIAASKGKTVSTLKVTKGGEGWAYHLNQPATDAALKSKAWNWVVLQDYSLNATHARKVEDFLKTGQEFEDRIAQEAPKANILLYETWAYAPRNPIFAAKAKPSERFASPDEMYGEIHKNYAALQAALQAKAAQRWVLIAPVGTAFAQCAREHPEINLYAIDFKHPSPSGSYLSALVLYATLFHDSPLGAAPGKKVDPGVAKTLQEVAAEVTQKR